MPELPDVAIFKQYFDSTALHETVAQVTVLDDAILDHISPRSLRRHLKGNTFSTTQRHGKHLFAQFDQESWLALHFGMTGDLKYFKQPSESPPYTRLSIDFTNGYHLAYISRRKLGRITLTDSPKAFIEARNLGPDAFDVDFDTFRERLERRSSAVKTALMNQRALAGIGNVYADEVLFQVGLHPKTRVNTLEQDALRAIHRTMRRVLRVAINHQADPEDLPATYLLPHRTEGSPCPRCGGTIKRTDVSGRSAYYCPACQPEPA